jgi:hypothetical protein
MTLELIRYFIIDTILYEQSMQSAYLKREMFLHRKKYELFTYQYLSLTKYAIEHNDSINGYQYQANIIKKASLESGYEPLKIVDASLSYVTDFYANYKFNDSDEKFFKEVQLTGLFPKNEDKYRIFFENIFDFEKLKTYLENPPMICNYTTIRWNK